MRIELLDEPSLPRGLRLALDVAAVGAVLAIAATLWPRDAVPPDLDLGTLPWWGGTRDLLLEGPDAGEWARNIQLVEQWRLDELDHHRLPAWMLMVAAAMKLQPDVVLAGHLVNRGLYLVLGLACYGLGRLRGGRMVGLLAAAMALGLPHVMTSSQRFGIDIAISAMIPTAMVVALAATRWWGLGLLAGLLAGITAGLHYTTPPYLLPPLLLLLLQGRGLARRAGAVLLYLLGAALSVRLLLEIYPVPSWAMFVGDIANGIAPEGGPGLQGQATVESALAGVRADLLQHASTATANAADVTRLPGLPWAVVLALPWLGVLGLGLGRARSGAGSWWRAFLLRTDVALGLALLACLAPLPVLTGVGAPERYGNNLLPVVVVLVARGAGSVASTLEALLRAAWSRWPRGPLLLLVAPLVWGAVVARVGYRNMPPPAPQELGAMLLADALRDLFPPGTGVASPIRESLVVAGLSFCPQTVCPTQASEDHFERCVRILAQQCAGDGPIGYVWTSATHFYDPNARRAEMDAWVAERWEVAAEVSYADFSARVYLVDRPDVAPDEDPLEGLPVPGQLPDGSVPPPPD